MVTRHTGIPMMRFRGAYPPCTPSVTIVADKNPFCLGDSVTFTPTFNCVDTATIESYEIKYGALYNWYAATDARNIAADGWGLPTDQDYITLDTYLSSNQGGKLKETGFIYWDTPNEGATNEVGFNGRGGGVRSLNGTFHSLKNYLFIYYDNGWGSSAFELLKDSSFLNSGGTNEEEGCSIRLIKTTTTLTHGQTGTYTGNDGKVYRTICIGTQEWLADNLAETLYRDLTPIPEVTDNAEWAALEDGAMCYYNNDINNAYTYTNDSEIISYSWIVESVEVSTSSAPYSTNTLVGGNRVILKVVNSLGQSIYSNMIIVQEKTEGCITEIHYGLLYNWYAATDVRKITSSDTWVVPTRVNVETLAAYLGGEPLAGGEMKETGLVYWDSPNPSTNNTKFNMRGSGNRGSSGGFGKLKQYAWFWTSTVRTTTLACDAAFGYNSTIFSVGLDQYNNNKNGASIRLMRTATAPEQLLADGTACTPYIGNDGKIYRTVKIGTQVWLSDNLAETQFRNSDYIHGFDGGVYTPISNAAWAALTTAGVCAYNNDLNNV